MNKSEYFALVKSWETKYGKPDHGMFNYDPSSVKACCEKCGKMRQHMSRHHKCNDFFFALWMPEIYARRYIEFRKEDCAKLCDYCHKSCERYYAKLKEELYAEFATLKGDEFGFAIISQGWCEEWRAQFLKMYNKWIKLAKRKKRKPRRKSRLATKPGDSKR